MGDWRADLCRASYSAWVAGDASSLLALYDPDCEWDLGYMAAAGMGPAYRGHAGLCDLMRDMTAAFDGFAPRIFELRLRGEQMLIRCDAVGTSNLMGIETATAPFGQVIEFRDGRILRVAHTYDPPPGWEDAQPVE
jgi:ketosteroid isomerase-like protein